MKILLTAIVKDDSESEMFTRMLDSFMPYFQGLAVAITGLSGEHKKLEKVIKKYKGQYVFTHPTTHPDIYLKDDHGWYFANFARAREVCFELAATMQAVENYDFWSWADTDDVLIGGEYLQDVATLAKEKDLDAIYFDYWYSCVVKDDKITDIAIQHLRERLLRPGMWKWVKRLHEIALPSDDTYQPKYAPWMDETKKVVWAHLPTTERVQGNLLRNAKILEMQIKEENHKDPRTVFYLGKTYIDLGNLQKDKAYFDLAEFLLQEYLQASGWAEERANAWQYLGQLSERKQNWKQAIERYMQGMSEFPNHHLILLAISRVYFIMEDWEKSKMWLTMASRLDAPSSRTTIGTPLEIKVLAATMHYNHALRETNLDEAIHYLGVMNKLLGVTESDQMKVLQESKLLNEAASWVINYAKWLKDHDHKEHMKSLLGSIPPEMKQERFYQVIANEALDPITWDKGSIVYFAGSQFAEWDPKTLLTEGSGGSERAVVRLSEEWVKLGHPVTVYGNLRNECEHNGVTYKHWASANWKDTFDTLIIWRNPGILDTDVKAHKILLDLHDVTSPLDMNEKRIEKVHKVFVKSQYHRKQLPNVPDDKIQVISNGL